jgi:hypothetical protein
MLFSIEIDEGTRIAGYLIPDSFSGSSAVRITDGLRELLVLQCNDERPHVAAAGRHATGRVGFSVDETVIPGLTQLEALEIHDEATNILIYRRRPPSQATQKKIFRLETHLLPLWRLDDAIDRYFQYFYKGVERYGLETATQLFLLMNSSSFYASGRLIFKTYEHYISDKFNCVALLHDPYMELAERLLTLKLVRKFAKKFDLLGARDMITFGPAIEFAEAIGPDERALHRAFSTMPTAAIGVLRNPLIRQLTARGPDEVPRKGEVAAALETLSSFSIVGLREHQDLFLAQLAGLIGVSPDTMAPMPDLSRTAELCEGLRSVPEVVVLIEQDLEVYLHVRAAIEKALTE